MHYLWSEWSLWRVTFGGAGENINRNTIQDYYLLHTTVISLLKQAYAIAKQMMTKPIQAARTQTGSWSFQQLTLYGAASVSTGTQHSWQPRHPCTGRSLRSSESMQKVKLSSGVKGTKLKHTKMCQHFHDRYLFSLC